MDIKDYLRKAAQSQNDVLEQMRKIQSDLAAVINDVESNAQAIEELGEIISNTEED